MDLSLEELMSIEVTSVSKKAEPLSEAAAAVFVITKDDIRRSGYQTIADVLRVVPGIEVGQLDSNKWAITSRGFGGQYASKLLVLIDGRSVYTPLFSGVYWDVQDLFMEDIKRIEVIRGPGATLWGTNAVNGVINVITEESGNTQGVRIKAGTGSKEKGLATVRYGGHRGENLSYRIYGKYFDRDHSTSSLVSLSADAWTIARGGFRVDWTPGPSNEVTLQADMYDGEAGTYYAMPDLSPPHSQLISEQVQTSGSNLLARWTHSISPVSDLCLQLYHDFTNRHDIWCGERRHTVDVDFQHGFRTLQRLDLVWGLGYRSGWYDFDDSEYILQIPDLVIDRNESLTSGFAQGDLEIVPDRLRLTLGCKLESKNSSGTEVQPNGRLLWLPDSRQALWGAVSHAARTATEAERTILFWIRTLPAGIPSNPGPLPLSLKLVGTRDFKSEELTSYELGYRIQPLQGFMLDISAFTNRYDDLRGLATGEPFMGADPIPHMVLPLWIENAQSARSHGAEIAIDYRARQWLRLRSTYSYLNMEVAYEIGNGSGIGYSDDGTGPTHQATLWSSVDLSSSWELDMLGRFVDELPDLNVDQYFTVNARLAWRALPNLQIALVGQNLLEENHLEVREETGVLPAIEVERSAYVAATWSFGDRQCTYSGS